MHKQGQNQQPLIQEIKKANVVSPQTNIQTQLVELWQEVLGVKVGIYDNFFELGGDSIQATIFFNRLQERFGGIFYIVALFEAPTIVEFEAYLHQYYPELVARISGQSGNHKNADNRDHIQPKQITQLQELIRPPLPQQLAPSEKNQSACFILSAARSGSTLLRVILAGHPQLFAPPQLCLLQFNTLMERRSVLTGEYSFWREGAIQALKKIKGCSTEEAQGKMEYLEEQQLTTKAFYNLLQQALTDEILVDKTTTYPFNLATLQRAETNFKKPIYIHLVRHPYGAIRSFEEAKLELTLTPFILKLKDRDAFPFTRRELAELLWLISNQNIPDFLQNIPPQRQYFLSFESLVTQPEATVKQLCQFLNLDFHSTMLQPYATSQQKMTEGLNAASGMLGDLKFYQHKGINANVANKWHSHYSSDFLGDTTWELAQKLGYRETVDMLSEREDGEI